MAVILLAVDGSEHADRALQWYLDHVHSTNNTVILCHVQEPIANAAFAFRAGLAVTEQQWAAMIKEAERNEKEFIEKYTGILEEKQVKYKVHVAAGDAGHHLCEAAKDNKVDLVVIGTRGQSAVRRTILGSVSDYVLHHAECPVVVCRQ